MGVWKKYNQEEIKSKIFNALQQNVDFRQGKFLGVPASHLDGKVFYSNAPFLKDAPYMTAMVANPNHIGCHTLGESEDFFGGTQKIEKELIRICSEDILKADSEGADGYVASGGTEANIQAMWIYRNRFIKEFGAKNEEIGLLCSEDTHYAVYKGSNLLGIRVFNVPVEETTRSITIGSLADTVLRMQQNGVRYVIVIANMGTTMFGSVDDPDMYSQILKAHHLPFSMHVDGAFGGFIYPFTATDTKLTFKNPDITSFTLDAHKLAQAPYGTGIFLIRKGHMQYTLTEEAKYVHGQDYTLVGSRSGANAIATWMILSTYGPHEWQEKILLLMHRADLIAEKLKEQGIPHYRHPKMNLVTMRASFIPRHLADEYHLVPDNHHQPVWYKIVVMEHVTPDLLVAFAEDLKQALHTPSGLYQ
jgi:glutamate/tyrosine decarboxylase-like PLP-dependent enzyme